MIDMAASTGFWPEDFLCKPKHIFFFKLAWWLTLILYSENEDGDIWYYSTEVQLENLLRVLDEDDMEYMLCREISEFREEINRQMEITEKVTVSQKGNKKSYIDSENGKLY